MMLVLLLQLLVLMLVLLELLLLLLLLLFRYSLVFPETLFAHALVFASLRLLGTAGDAAHQAGCAVPLTKAAILDETNASRISTKWATRMLIFGHHFFFFFFFLWQWCIVGSHGEKVVVTVSMYVHTTAPNIPLSLESLFYSDWFVSVTVEVRTSTRSPTPMHHASYDY